MWSLHTWTVITTYTPPFLRARPQSRGGAGRKGGKEHTPTPTNTGAAQAATGTLEAQGNTGGRKQALMKRDQVTSSTPHGTGVV